MSKKNKLLGIVAKTADVVIKEALKRPLPAKKLMAIKEEASHRQLAEVMNELNLYDFIRTERALYDHCRTTQRLVLQNIVRTNADTEIGKKYHFDEIKSVSDFREKVPVSAWDDYAQDTERMAAGEEDILFPGKATFFYRTSGTTSDFKYIPESEREVVARKALSQARYLEMVSATSVKALTRVFSFYNRTAIAETDGGIPAGTASGRTAQMAGDASTKLSAYHPQLVEELEDEALYYTIMRTTIVFDDVSAILGNNAHMMTMMVDFAKEHAKEIIEDIRFGTNKYELSDLAKEKEAEALAPNPKRADELEKLLRNDQFTPRYYWPNLVLASFWLGGSVGVFVDEVREILPETTKFVDVGYGASEAKINIPLIPDTPQGALSIFSSFYEFLPEDGGEPLLADELEVGKTYEIMLTTYAGLYRYRLKDYVYVDGFTGDTPNIHFLSKSSDMANLVQEKLAGSLLANAIHETVEENGMSFALAQVYPDEATTSYAIYIEAGDVETSAEEFAGILDDALCEKLERYEIYRHHTNQLKPCRVRFMKAGWQEALSKKYAKGNATTAQVKIPVVVRQIPEDEWCL